jgi:hypothetical protein
MVNSRFSRQWFCDRKAMNELSVHGGGAVFARISERFGLRLEGLGMFFGIVTVRGGATGWYSAMAMLVSWISGSARDAVGDETVEDVVLIDKASPVTFRWFITVLQNCLYTLLAVVLVCSSEPRQGLYGGLNGCASLMKQRGTRFVQNLATS